MPAYRLILTQERL